MSYWLAEMLHSSNERFLEADDLTRVGEYLNTAAARVRLAEVVERIEPELERDLIERLVRQYPQRTAYSARLVRDVIESMRVAVAAMLADDARVMRPVTDHLLALARNLDLPGELLAAPYTTLLTLLSERLDVPQYGLLEPYLAQVPEALTVV